MQENPRNYVGGSVDYIDKCNVDRMSLIEVLSMLKHCGGPAGFPTLWYKLPGTDMERGLFFLDCDAEVSTMCSLLPSSRYIEVYVVVSPPLRQLHADLHLNYFEFENIQIQQTKAKSTQVKKGVIDTDDSSSSDNDVVRPFNTTSSSSGASPNMRQEKGEGNERLRTVRNEADKVRVLKSVKAYKPKQPNFKVKVGKSYVYGGSMTVLQRSPSTSGWKSLVI